MEVTVALQGPLSLPTEPLREQRLPELTGFLGRAFGVDAPALLEKSFLNWKFFDVRPEWDKPRSYVVMQDEQIAAHACLWPTAFICSSGFCKAGHILD